MKSGSKYSRSYKYLFYSSLKLFIAEINLHIQNSCMFSYCSQSACQLHYIVGFRSNRATDISAYNAQ